MEILKCDIGNVCLETHPCKHNCTVTFSNGTETQPRLSGWTLATNKYWEVLDDSSKKHFLYMRKLVMRGESDNAEYTLFLKHDFETTAQ